MAKLAKNPPLLLSSSPDGFFSIEAARERAQNLPYVEWSERAPRACSPRVIGGHLRSGSGRLGSASGDPDRCGSAGEADGCRVDAGAGVHAEVEFPRLRTAQERGPFLRGVDLLRPPVVLGVADR